MYIFSHCPTVLRSKFTQECFATGKSTDNIVDCFLTTLPSILYSSSNIECIPEIINQNSHNRDNIINLSSKIKFKIINDDRYIKIYDCSRRDAITCKMESSFHINERGASIKSLSCGYSGSGATVLSLKFDELPQLNYGQQYKVIYDTNVLIEKDTKHIINSNGSYDITHNMFTFFNNNGPVINESYSTNILINGVRCLTSSEIFDSTINLYNYGNAIYNFQAYFPSESILFEYGIKPQISSSYNISTFTDSFTGNGLFVGNYNFYSNNIFISNNIRYRSPVFVTTFNAINTISSTGYAYQYRMSATGSNTSGTLGIGNTTTPITSFTNINQFNLGNIHDSFFNSDNYTTIFKYVIKIDGTLWVWGISGTSPAQVGTSTWNKIYMSYNQIHGIKTNGTLHSLTSAGVSTQIGTDTDWDHMIIPVTMHGYNATDTSDYFAVKSNGTLWNSLGQIGSDNDWNSAIIACNGSSTHAIKSNGTLWSWGNNAYGQLGLGDTTNRTNPTQVGTDNNWSKIYIAGSTSQSNQHTYAIKNNGTLWGCGYNSNGNLGIGNTISPITSFTQIGSDTNWIELDYVSGYQVISLHNNGTLWAWGENGGCLGLGDSTNRSSPTQIGTDTNWVKILPFSGITSASNFTYAIKSNGTLWSWGLNSSSQLGLGDSVNRNAPTQIGTDTNWIDILANTYLRGNSNIPVFAYKSDNTLWAWGQNSAGQLGVGNTNAINSPTQTTYTYNKIYKIKDYNSQTYILAEKWT